MNARQLILVKHARPEIVPGSPARQWHLSDEGRVRCEALAARLAAYHPEVILSSSEPKAVETAAIVAERLGVSTHTVGGLHEHDRSNTGHLDQAAFERRVRAFFEHPQERVFGLETAAQAEARFTEAVHAALSAHQMGNLVLVAHGTVISLFTARCTGAQAFALWQRLGLPSYIALALPEGDLKELVENV